MLICSLFHVNYNLRLFTRSESDIPASRKTAWSRFIGTFLTYGGIKLQRFIISFMSHSIWLFIRHLTRPHSSTSDFRCGWMDQVFSAGHVLITVLPRCKRWKIVRYYGGAQLHMRLQLWCSTRCLESVSTTALKRLSTSDIRIIYLHKLVSVRHLLITTQAPLTHWSKVR